MQWNSLLNPANGPFVALRRDVERHLGMDSEPTYAGLSVVESEDRWTVSVDVPGLLEGDVNITVQDGLLVIEGERPPKRVRRRSQSVRGTDHAGRCW